MTTCLVALGSNLGDRAAMLDGAIRELGAAPGIDSVRASSWQLTLPVGELASQREFLNGAALVETSLAAVDLLELLQQIEARYGRERHERWGSRTLDLDLLVFGDEVIDTPELTVPHPRMSFRRFVLEPAAEIAGEMVHPTIGCTISQLLDQLEVGADCVAIASHDATARAELAAKLARRFGMLPCAEAASDAVLWPADLTTWLTIPHSQQSAGNPKLTVMLNEGFQDAKRRASVRGPTLRVPAADGQSVEADVFAAIEAVWPRLGPLGGQRLQYPR